MIYQLVALAALASVSVASQCDPEWRYFPLTNSCYKPIRDRLPWTIAEFKCLFQGAHHVSIQSYEENQFVHELVYNGEMWTGSAYFGKNPQYVNSDQSSFGRFENWETGSRPALNKARRCIKLNSSGQWFQSCCKKISMTVCKKGARGDANAFSFTNSVESRRRFRL